MPMQQYCASAPAINRLHNFMIRCRLKVVQYESFKLNDERETSQYCKRHALALAIRLVWVNEAWQNHNSRPCFCLKTAPRRDVPESALVIVTLVVIDDVQLNEAEAETTKSNGSRTDRHKRMNMCST